MRKAPTAWSTPDRGRCGRDFHPGDDRGGVAAVCAGLAVIIWMTVSHPVHTYLTIVFGTTAIFLVGLLLSSLRSAP